jgi:hypothetical protein
MTFAVLCRTVPMVPYLTFATSAINTAFSAKLRETRNCGDGHVHVYGLGTRTCGLGTANALTQPILKQNGPGPRKDAGRFLMLQFPPIAKHAMDGAREP